MEEVQQKGMYDKFTPGYSTPGDDNSQVQMSDTRKTRLTLLQISKLRRMNDVRQYEQKLKLKSIKDLYGPGVTAEPEGDMGF